MVKKESSIKVSMLSKDLHQYVLNQMELYQSCIGRCYFIVTWRCPVCEDSSP